MMGLTNNQEYINLIKHNNQLVTYDEIYLPWALEI